MTQNRIALCGKIRSGKSTASVHINLMYGFTPFAFADELKRTYHGLFPHVPRDPKPREAYQRYGEMIRELDPNVWVNATMRMISYYQPSRVLIEDLRLQTEWDALRSAGYTIIRINATDEIRMKRAIDAGDDFTVHDLVHETESNVDGFSVDYDVDNNGTNAELIAKLDAVMAKINKR